MDYFTRTYVSGQPYSSQKSFMRARPQTNVKLMTTNRSQVNYTSTPQATLRKPYQHDTYDEMPYLFSGYPAVRRNWFDSKVGGQGEKLGEYATKSVMPYSHIIQRIDGAWATARDTAAGETIYLESAYQVNCLAGVDGADFICQRLFLSFDLRNILFDEINSCYFGCYAAYPSAYTYSTISIQEGAYNAFLYPTNLSIFSQFKGAPFTIKRFTYGWNLLPFNRSGIKYVKKSIGNTANFCIREYDHDFKNVEPGAKYTNSMFTKTIRLFLNHKGDMIIIKPEPASSGGDDGFKLIPA